MQHVKQVATGEGSDTITADQIDIDKSMVAGQGDAGVTRIQYVEVFRRAEESGTNVVAPGSPRRDSMSSPRTQLVIERGANVP